MSVAGGGAQFVLGVVDGGLDTELETTGIPRLHTRKFMERILWRRSEAGCLRPGDYWDLSANASYFLAPVARCLEGVTWRTESTCPLSYSGRFPPYAQFTGRQGVLQEAGSAD